MQADRLFGLRFDFHPDHHFAALGKLNGVPHQVHQDLAQAPGIAHQVFRHAFSDVLRQFQVFLVRANGKRLQRFAQRLAQVEIYEVKVELPRLNLGKVQDVVNHAQQVIGRGFHHG